MERSRYIRTSNRKQVWYAVGTISDKIVRDMKEIERQKKSSGEPCFSRSGAPEGVDPVQREAGTRGSNDGEAGTVPGGRRPCPTPADGLTANKTDIGRDK